MEGSTDEKDAGENHGAGHDRLEAERVGRHEAVDEAAALDGRGARLEERVVDERREAHLQVPARAHVDVEHAVDEDAAEDVQADEDRGPRRGLDPGRVRERLDERPQDQRLADEEADVERGAPKGLAQLAGEGRDERGDERPAALRLAVPGRGDARRDRRDAVARRDRRQVVEHERALQAELEQRPHIVVGQRAQEAGGVVGRHGAAARSILDVDVRRLGDFSLAHVRLRATMRD